jgi:transcriptional regulator
MAGSDLYTGTLDVIVLKALSGGSMHGYAIGSWIRKNSKEAIGVREGVLYPALHRLERKGLVQALWGKTDTGRRAKFYTLTEAGTEHLEVETKRLTEHSEAVLTLLRTSGR